MTVLISGAGIAGLSLALTCHQIGIPVRVFEQVQTVKPLGVGINLQPHAVRELFELGLEGQLLEAAVKTQEVAYFTKTGLPIWSEQRGHFAGYRWPQLSIHRGTLQMLLYSAVLDRLGKDAIETGTKITTARSTEDGVIASTLDNSGVRTDIRGDVLIGADGIHSAIRAQHYPKEGSPIWGGAVLWRGTTIAKPFLTGATMAMAGHAMQKFVTYPISPVDPASGTQVINWIAELVYDPTSGWNREDWNRPGKLQDFLPAFEAWTFDWLDIPAIIRGAEAIFEYPMVDRDPLPRWTFGHTTLLGDAAHAMYPIGSNGASQAILDARYLGRELLSDGPTHAALSHYEAIRRPATSKIVQANRGNGPDQIMEIVEQASGGVFETVTDVIPMQELENHAASYKSLAGFDKEALNQQASIIP